ncbi:MAG: transposase family protein [bacterium]
MKPYQLLNQVTDAQFKRSTGLSKDDFQRLSTKVSRFIQQDKDANPVKKRGRKSSGVSQENRLLIVLYYLRHYPTFENLADVFSMSESYCYKLYIRYRKILGSVDI